MSASSSSQPRASGAIEQGQTFRERVQEVTAEYWATREEQTERVAVAQLILALVRTEAEVAQANAVLKELS